MRPAQQATTFAFGAAMMALLMWLLRRRQQQKKVLTTGASSSGSEGTDQAGQAGDGQRDAAVEGLYAVCTRIETALVSATRSGDARRMRRLRRVLRRVYDALETFEGADGMAGQRGGAVSLGQFRLAQLDRLCEAGTDDTGTTPEHTHARARQGKARWPGDGGDDDDDDDDDDDGRYDSDADAFGSGYDDEYAASDASFQSARSTMSAFEDNDDEDDASRAGDMISSTQQQQQLEDDDGEHGRHRHRHRRHRHHSHHSHHRRVHHRSKSRKRPGRKQAAAAAVARKETAEAGEAAGEPTRVPRSAEAKQAEKKEEEVEEEEGGVSVYEEALALAQQGDVPCRVERTEETGCADRTDFLTRLHCVREASDLMMGDKEFRVWFTRFGRDLLGSLVEKGGGNLNTFHTAYDNMMSFLDQVSQEGRTSSLLDELKPRGVVRLSLFDAVVDIILLDAFDDMKNLPGTVTSVLQNSWIPTSVKQNTLNTAIWSVISAKERTSPPDGLLKRLYSIFKVLSPVLACGLMGCSSQPRFKELCEDFKAFVEKGTRDWFQFDKDKYTSHAALAEDMKHLWYRKADEAKQIVAKYQ
ncbi:hypothetical protein PTSG_04823 [Salpingoeca rosetta]|uniref:Uncharacterized protein n=1 Tax=Salpingoeca rosetta (strain ATCC 50818 / BSB-021) TaxID=946362 RepID=F2U9T2_SALR5|nr:uncharacterized protein PTSG_04823 [Salpingoeca rosetta]EGD73109.1 hypothetical protein PTSG_04823 [Salpingoeca rosetta]|eukprot:XP_004994140.1 hypothetical protein PTSG_04823 [Salpingoeca rosetta]